MCGCPRGAVIETGWGLNICSQCGVTVGVPISLLVNYAVPCSGRPPYSKHKRFAKLLCHSYGHRVSRIHPSLIEKLNKTVISSAVDIYNLIRASKGTKMKRYDAIASLCIYKLGSTITPLNHNQNMWASHIFRDVVSLHARNRGTFPAYSWCIEKCLIALGREDLLRYVHRLKCKKRRTVYEHVYGHLFKTPCGVRESPSFQRPRKSVQHRQREGYTGMVYVRD